MSEAVILKSNRYGIQLHLDDEIPFETLKERILGKFEESEKFFRDASFAISFEGRELSEDEENEIVTMINEKTTTHVICIVAEDEIREEILRKKTEAEELIKKQDEAPEEAAIHPNEAIVRSESIQSDEVLIADQSLVIYGDVPPGATVTSKGNVTVLGNLRGKVWAGSDGKEDAFVFALAMEPESLRIGPVVMAAAESGGFHPFKSRKSKDLPKIARMTGGMVEVTPYEF